MRETLAGLWTSGYWVFGALALALLLADLIAFAFGRRMLNPKHLTDHAYSRLRQRLTREGVLDKDVTYEPRAVGTLVGHWRSIRAWSVAMTGAVNALVTVACVSGALLFPFPHVAGAYSTGLRLALGFWLALGLQLLGALVGGAAGNYAAMLSIAPVSSDGEAGATVDEEVVPNRHWPRMPVLLSCAVIVADVGATMALVAHVSISGMHIAWTSGVNFDWLARYLLFFTPLMVLSLVLGEVFALLAYRRRPLLLSSDAALARRADVWLREGQGWACVGGGFGSTGLLAFAQYGTMLLLSLPSPYGQGIDTLRQGSMFVYLVMYVVLMLTGASISNRGGRRTRSPMPAASAPQLVAAGADIARHPNG